MPNIVLCHQGANAASDITCFDYYYAKLLRSTVYWEIFTLLNFCEFCELRLSRKNFSRKNLCRQLVGAVIVGRGILLSLHTSLYGCECVWCLSDGSFKVF